MKAKPVIINGVEIYPTGAILGKALDGFRRGHWTAPAAHGTQHTGFPINLLARAGSEHNKRMISRYFVGPHRTEALYHYIAKAFVVEMTP